MTQVSSPSGPDQVVIHATTVSVDGKGVLIIGPSGAGKSSLALELMAMGAVLVADDRTIVVRHEAGLRASVPNTIKGKIEARGVGVLTVPDAGTIDLGIVVDLAQTTKDRMPEAQHHTILGMPIECLHHVPATHFASAVWFYVKGMVSTPA